MNHERLQALIESWEPEGSEVVRILDNVEGTLERIVKIGCRPDGPRYSLYRYFETGVTASGDCAESRTHVSVDLEDIDADQMICEMAERV